MEWIIESGEAKCVIHAPEGDNAAGCRITLPNISLAQFISVGNPDPGRHANIIGRFVIDTAVDITRLNSGTRVAKEFIKDGSMLLENVGLVALREFGGMFSAKIRAEIVLRISQSTGKLPSEIADSLTLFDAHILAADLIERVPNDG